MPGSRVCRDDTARGRADPPRATKAAPVWFQVDVRYVKAFPRVLPLEELRGMKALSEMALFKRMRLSISPVTPSQWKAVLAQATRP